MSAVAAAVARPMRQPLGQPLGQPTGTPRRHLEVVPSRAQRRARPRMLPALVTIGGIAVILLAQLLLSIVIADGAYQISALQSANRPTPARWWIFLLPRPGGCPITTGSPAGYRNASTRCCELQKSGLPVIRRNHSSPS